MKQKYAIGVFTLTLFFSLVIHSYASASDSAAQEIRAVGRGPNQEEATKKALQSAVEQVVGVLVYSTTKVENEKVTLDRLDMLSNGFVESYKTVSTTSDGDTRIVTIEAKVIKGTVADFIKSKGIETKIDLKNNWSQLTGSIRAKKQAVDIFTSKVDQIKANLFRARLIELKTGKYAASLPAPYLEEDLDGVVTCLWAARVEPDLEFWADCAHPMLKACFEALCVGRKTIRIKYGPGSPGIAYYYPGNGHGSKKNMPELPPDFFAVTYPVTQWTDDPGLHPSLFMEQNRPYQGELVFEGQGGLFGVLLERPFAEMESEVTFYFLTREVMQRLSLPMDGYSSTGKDNWCLSGKAIKADGSSESWQQSDSLDGVIGKPVAVSNISLSDGPIYFGPWIQSGGNHLSISIKRGSRWPVWKDLSCYTERTGWALNVLHGGKMYPLYENYGGITPPFAKWLYQPLVFTMPVDDLPKISRLSISLDMRTASQ